MFQAWQAAEKDFIRKQAARDRALSTSASVEKLTLLNQELKDVCVTPPISF